MRRLNGSQQDPNRIPTVEERMQLSYDIFKIDNTEMARVLTIIEADCPEALSRKSDEVLINFDALSAACFHQVNLFTQTALVDSAGGPKKKKRPIADVSSSSSSSSSSSNRGFAKEKKR